MSYILPTKLIYEMKYNIFTDTMQEFQLSHVKLALPLVSSALAKLPSQRAFWHFGKMIN